MNYQSIYDRLITRAKGRVLVGYGEDHHIRPRCIGGSDATENIARLTAEEHYIAHLLLVKIHPREKALVFAAIVMCGATSRLKRNNKAFGWLRRKNAEAVRGFRHTPETIAKLSAGRTGAIVSRETRDKLSAANRGYIHTEEARSKMTATRRRLGADGNWHGMVTKGEKLPEAVRVKMKQWHENNPISAETRAKISAAGKARVYSEQTRLNMSNAAKTRVYTPEGRAKLGAGRKGRKVSEATKAKMSAAAIGKPKSPRTRVRMSIAQRLKHGLPIPDQLLIEAGMAPRQETAL